MFAECYVFVKQSHGPVYCASIAGGPLLPKLRGYVAEFLNEVSLARLGIFYPPTCVGFGTDSGSITRSFSRKYGIGPSGSKLPSTSPFGLGRADLPAQPAYGFERAVHQAAVLTHSELRRSNSPRKYWNIDQLSIGYAFRPRLRIRLTPGGRTCPGKPWDSGDRDSHPVFRYSCPHSRFRAVHRRLRFGFGPRGTLLYHSSKKNPQLRHQVYSRSFSAQNLSTSQLLRTV